VEPLPWARRSIEHRRRFNNVKLDGGNRLANALHLAHDHPQLRRRHMAKGQQKSNREKKKPKQDKAKPVAATSQFSVSQPKPTGVSSSGKKQ
jgi:hypothetical protein